MKNTNLILLLILGFSLISNAQSKKERKAIYDSQYNYEIQSLGVGQDGTKLLKIWGYGKKPDDAVYEAKRNAVAAVIFRGIPAGNGAATTPSILPIDGYEKNMEFFDDFYQRVFDKHPNVNRRLYLLKTDNNTDYRVLRK